MSQSVTGFFIKNIVINCFDLCSFFNMRHLGILKAEKKKKKKHVQYVQLWDMKLLIAQEADN